MHGVVLVIGIAAAISPEHERWQGQVDPGLTALLNAHCVDCHEGGKAKGGFNFEQLLAGAAPAGDDRAATDAWRAVRWHVARQDMPPLEEAERPSQAEYAAMVAALDMIVEPRRREVPAVRRLNRWQVANSIRDVIGRGGADPFALRLRDIALSVLPPDDVGEGFDTTAATLGVPPLQIERMLELAEQIAAAAVPRADEQSVLTVPMDQIEIKGQGGNRGAIIGLATQGTLTARLPFMSPGRYRVEAIVSAQQAGPEVARAEFLVNGTKQLSTTLPDEPPQQVVDVPFVASSPGMLVWEGDLQAGEHTIGVGFVNDYYNPTHPDPAERDRNFHLHGIRIIGPLGGSTETPFQQWARSEVDADSQRDPLGHLAAALSDQLFSQRVAERDARALARTARNAAGGGGPATGAADTANDVPDTDHAAALRALVTTVLVDPRFVLRIEEESSGRAGERSLTARELAFRLALFLWSSVPDDLLLTAAESGELTTDAALQAQVHRMLADERATSLAERFFTQWLGIDRLEGRHFDTKQYAALRPDLLKQMRSETEWLCHQVVNGNAPLRALLTDTTAHANAGPQLKQHYRKSTAHRPTGVLGHASVLAATSNPSRTSPVKRGKWVLDVLLDQPPAPPPPGTPQLPEGKANKDSLSIRELMALHRKDATCAACHVRMDAIGLAFERWDADAKWRDTADGHAISELTELPGGRSIDGVAGVQALVEEGIAFERSLSRRLLVYALGRGSTDWDDSLITELALTAKQTGSFEKLVQGLVLSDQFRKRRVTDR